MCSPVRWIVCFVFCVIHIVSAVSEESNGEDKSLGTVTDILASEDKDELSVHIEVSPRNTDVSPSRQESLNTKSFKDQLYAGGERLLQRVGEAKQYMYETTNPWQKQLYRQASDALDAANEITTTMRQNMESSKRGKIVLDILNQNGLMDTTLEEKFGILINAVSAEMVNHVPEYAKIQPIEVDTLANYICGAKGLISSLTTIEKGISIVKPNEEGFKFEINYKFNSLYLNYTEFYINVLAAFTASGHLHLKFSENNVKITLQIPPLRQIFKKLVNKECIVDVVNLEVTRLDFEKSTLTAKHSSVPASLIDTGILKYLQGQQEKLRVKFEQGMLVAIHRKLDTQDAWICRDKGFTKLVQSKGGNLQEFIPSDKFKLNCGTVLFIESPQNSVEEKRSQ